MKNHYQDILSRIPEAPVWWDENAVPRWCAFEPIKIADVYADECALLLIACQDCGRPFKVAASSNMMSTYQISNAIKEGFMNWGDPPNIGCCPAGPTMNSQTLAVLEYWSRKNHEHEWARDETLEREQREWKEAIL